MPPDLNLTVTSSLFLQEKYDRAVQKINQLKDERDKLKEAIEAQSEEISKWVIFYFKPELLELIFSLLTDAQVCAF